MSNMILFNQIPDCFSPNAHFEETPSMRLDAEFEESISKTLSVPDERLQLERKCQQILLSDEVNELLMYAVKCITLIEKIQKKKAIPMVAVELFDPRDFPQMYNELLELYFQLFGEDSTFEKASFSTPPIQLSQIHNVYGIEYVQQLFNDLPKLISLHANVEALKLELNYINAQLGLPERETASCIPNITMSTLQHYIGLYNTLCEKLIWEKNDICKKNAEKQFQEAVEMACEESNIIIFSTWPYDKRDFCKIPELQSHGFILDMSSPDANSIADRYLSQIEFSPHYLVQYCSKNE